jgi:dephospho-CoA kinase
VRRQLVDRWGDDVAPGGEVDRDRVADIVFDAPDELAWLESVTHPAVGQEVARWSASLTPGTVGVIEVPLLFEVGMEDAFDAVVCVVADEATRTARAATRGHEGVGGREDRQLSQAEKAERADHVVENDGTIEELEGKLATLLPQLAGAN